MTKITNNYIREETATHCYILGKRDGRTPSFTIDSEDESLVRGHTWNMDRKGYVKCTCCNLLLHRLLTGAVSGEFVDHINREPWSNQRNNLRIVTHAENLRNRMANKDKAWGIPVRGVYYTGSNWRVETTKNGVRFPVKHFDALPEAVCYKIRREYELYGEHSPNYRRILKRMPRELLLSYFPEIYGNHNHEFIGTPIFKAHYKNSKHNNWYGQCVGVRKAGTTV